MPDIQKLYDTYDTEGDDALIVLGIAAPNMGSEQSEEGIKNSWRITDIRILS